MFPFHILWTHQKSRDLFFGGVESRSSYWQMFFKMDVLNNFAIFTGKLLCRSLFLITRLQHRYFPVNILQFLRTAFFIERLWWLHLRKETLLWNRLIKSLKIISCFQEDVTFVWKWNLYENARMWYIRYEMLKNTEGNLEYSIFF